MKNYRIDKKSNIQSDDLKVKIDNFKSPSEELKVYEFLLKADDPQVLFIPEGFANGFQAKKENSKL